MFDDKRESEWLTAEAASMDGLQILGRKKRRQDILLSRSANAVAYLDLNGRGTSFDALVLTQSNSKEYIMLGQSGTQLFQLSSIGAGAFDPRDEAEILESAICALETTGMLQCREWEDTRWDLPQAAH